eukprot:1363089-Rhodomonas_salina.1
MVPGISQPVSSHHTLHQYRARRSTRVGRYAAYLLHPRVFERSLYLQVPSLGQVLYPQAPRLGSATAPQTGQSGNTTLRRGRILVSSAFRGAGKQGLGSRKGGFDRYSGLGVLVEEARDQVCCEGVHALRA